METLLHDLRYAIRTLRKRPGFATVAVLTLALGIGATTAIFSVVHGVLLSPLPYEAPEQLVRVWQRNAENGIERGGISPPNLLDFRERSHAFEELAAYQSQEVALTGEGEPERVAAALVTPNLFRALRAEPALGRTFFPGEDVYAGDRVALLSHGLWQRRFSADPAVLGRTASVNGRPYTIVGVLAPGFDYPDRSELWVPISAPPTVDRRNIYLSVLGRLEPGATVEQAQVEMETIIRGLAREYPDALGGWGVEVASLREAIVGEIEPALLVLLGAVGFVLLIACSNVANLFLARAAGRGGEIAVRTALGVGRWRLVRQLLTESLVLALTGGALGLLLGFWGVDLLATLGPGDLPRLENIEIDGAVLGFATAVTLLTALVFGLFPALQASRPDLVSALKETTRGSQAGWGNLRLRSVLVISEMTLAVLLLVGAGLLMNSFAHLRQVDPGFDADRVLAFDLSLPSSRYAEDRERAAFYTELVEQIGRLPGVREAAAVSYLPLSGDHLLISFRIEGRPELPFAERPVAYIRVATPEYFRAMGIPLLRGRPFAERDDRDAPGVVLINEAAARSFWPGEDPIGQRLTTYWGREGIGGEVVGVVGSVRRTGLAVEAEPAIYIPYLQAPVGDMSVVVRAASDPAALAGAVRRLVHARDDQLPLADMRTMEAVVTGSIAQPRFYSLVLALFASVALVLAAVGIYGVLAYTVGQRTHEVGIRMALGARGGDVLRLVVSQGLTLALGGLAVGLLAAFALTRVLSSMLYGVSATDPFTFANAALVLVLVALAASYLPARRAARVDPMAALRYE